MAPSPGCWEERPKEAPAGDRDWKDLGLPRRNRGSLCERKASEGAGLPEEALWALSEPWSCPLRWLRGQDGGQRAQGRPCSRPVFPAPSLSSLQCFERGSLQAFPLFGPAKRRKYLC